MPIYLVLGLRDLDGVGSGNVDGAKLILLAMNITFVGSDDFSTSRSKGYENWCTSRSLEVVGTMGCQSQGFLCLDLQGSLLVNRSWLWLLNLGRLFDDSCSLLIASIFRFGWADWWNFCNIVFIH